MESSGLSPAGRGPLAAGGPGSAPARRRVEPKAGSHFEGAGLSVYGGGLIFPVSRPQSFVAAVGTAFVESRITSSGVILCREMPQSRFSSPALIPSTTVFTARFPMASRG